MRIRDIGTVHSGYITRGKIETATDGSHYLVQAKDMDGEWLTYRTDQLVRFHPNLSRADLCLQKGDLLFMARGVHNFTVQINALPQPALAAACFFIVRVSTTLILPSYLAWYLNQAPVAQYLVRHSGRGVHMPVIRRAVLENIEVPLAPMKLQVTISGISDLLFKEGDLLRRLGLKRREMMTTACLQAVSGYEKGNSVS